MKTVGEIIDKFIKEVENELMGIHHLKMTISRRYEDGIKFVTVEAGARYHG